MDSSIYLIKRIEKNKTIYFTTSSFTFLNSKVLSFLLKINTVIIGANVAKINDQKSSAVDIHPGKYSAGKIFPTNILFSKV